MAGVLAGFLLLISVFSLCGCTQPSAAEHPHLVTDLRFSPSAFDSFRGNTQLRYRLAAPSVLTIYITRLDTFGEEQLVRTIMQNLSETRGVHSHTWLGDTEQGFFAPVGRYVGVVRTERRRFETLVTVYHQ